MSGPTLRQLRTLLAVVETGGISAAARRLGITQPAASQQLRELERAVGVRLLDRAGGRSLPTAAGHAILPPARRALAGAADAAAAAAAFRSGDIGRVRIGTGATACIYLLPAVLAAAKRRMPGLEVIVATGNSSAMVQQVEAGDLDLALITLPAAATPALDVTPLLTDPLVALVPAGMATAAATVGMAAVGTAADAMATPGATMDAATLAGLPLILYEPAGTTRALIDGWFRAAGVAAVPAMQLDSAEAIKVLVGGGVGASVLPALALPHPVAGAVVRDLCPGLQRDLGIVLRREKIIDRGLRVMLDALMLDALMLDALASAPGQVYSRKG
jgi:DNA-binding transcriptional LysR family regulator